MPRAHRRILAVPLVGALAVGASVAGSAAAGAGTVSPSLRGPHGASARPHLRTELRPSVRNALLNETLGEHGDEGDNPNLAALCQNFLHGSTPFRPLGSNVDVIRGDRTTKAGTQQGCSTAQNETVVAVNPQNPKNLVAGSNDYRLYNAREKRNDGSGWAYTSMDGGKTWKNVVLPGLTVMTGAQGKLKIMDSAGDPAIAFGPDNTVYYANIAFSRLTTANGITVNVSHDGGLTWGKPKIVRLDGVAADGTAAPTKFFNDKEWIGVDPTSGRVYVTWTRFTFQDESQDTAISSPIAVSTSAAGGGSWSAPRTIGPKSGHLQGHFTPYGSGTVPQVGKDGTLYVAYETAVCKTLACDSAGDHDATVVARSTDQGRTSKLTEVGVNFDFPTNPDVDRGTLTGEVFRVNSFPGFAVDRSTGRLHVTWADDRNGSYDKKGNSIQTNGDVLSSSSADGRTWSRVRATGSSQDEVFPWVAAARGRTATSFYTRRYDPIDPATGLYGVGLDYAMTGSGISGTRRLTTQTSDPRIQFVSLGLISHNVLSGVFIGDYTGIALGSDLVAHPVWTDFRGNPGTTKPNQDVVTGAVQLH